MAEQDKVFEGKVKHTGLFNYKELYTFTYKWLIDEGYKVDEKVYSEKVTPGGKELDIDWEASKKVSDYFKFVIKAKWKILGMTSVDAEDPNTKKSIKLEKGQIEIKVTAVLVKDYEHRWENTAFLKFLRGVYDRYLVRARIEDYEKKIFGEADEFIAQTKAFLALEGIH